MYLEVDEDFPSHPKSIRLCAGIQNPIGWAYMLKLWAWAKKYQKDGDLSGYTAEEIEFSAGWTGEAGRFYASAVRAGFIDESSAGGSVTGRVLHNWMARSGGGIKRAEDEATRKRLYRLHRSEKCSPDSCPHCAAEGDESLLTSDATGNVPGPSADASGTSRGRGADVLKLVPVTSPDESHQDKTSQDKTRQDQSRPVQSSQDKTSQDQRSEADGGLGPLGPTPPPLGIFPCMPGKSRGPRSWPFTQDSADVLREAFPGHDVVAAAKRAKVWLVANPGKRKTYDGMLEFLRRWISREVNASEGGPRPRAASRSDGNIDALKNWNPAEGSGQ